MLTPLTNPTRLTILVIAPKRCSLESKLFTLKIIPFWSSPSYFSSFTTVYNFLVMFCLLDKCQTCSYILVCFSFNDYDISYNDSTVDYECHSLQFLNTNKSFFWCCSIPCFSLSKSYLSNDSCSIYTSSHRYLDIT